MLTLVKRKGGCVCGCVRKTSWLGGWGSDSHPPRLKTHGPDYTHSGSVIQLKLI